MATMRGHEPVTEVDPRWPVRGCSGVLRRYPSGDRACDCGSVVIKAVSL